MTDGLPAAAAAREFPCKCCNVAAPLLGVVDFHRSCLDNRRPPVPLSGIPIYYHRCPACGLIFTTAFDSFTHEQFARFIYNDQYIQFDPDWLDARPRANAEYLTRIFGGSKQQIRILDYGGGSGLLERLLRERGFTRVRTYDPFVPEHAERPNERFDLVLAFEVVEHSPRPREIFADMLSLRSEDGICLFSTALPPPDIERIGVGWWFIAPRNGHVSMHTHASVARLIHPAGLRMISTPSGVWHMLLRDVPDFAKHLKIPPP